MEAADQIIDSDIYTAEQIASLLKCDKETAEARIRSGDLPGVKYGKSWVIPRQALRQCLNEMALSEAAQRKADLQGTRAAALEKGRPSTKAAAAPSPMLPTSEQPRKRGQSRRPPDLGGLLASHGMPC